MNSMLISTYDAVIGSDYYCQQLSKSMATCSSYAMFTMHVVMQIAAQQAALHLYMVQSLLQCHDYMRAEQCVERALSLLNIRVALTGILGKRTQFQQRNIAQLAVTVERQYLGDEDDNELANTPNDLLPTNCALKDDTLLDAVKFADGDVDALFQQNVSPGRAQ